MLVTYFLAAAISTIFAITLALNRSNHMRRMGQSISGSLPPKTHTKFIYQAFLDSAKGLLYLLLVFAIAMHLTTIYRFSSAHKNSTKPVPKSVPTYSGTASLFMAEFSVLPAILVQSATENMFLGGNLVRQTLWLLLIVFAIVVNFLFRFLRYASIDASLGPGFDTKFAVFLQDLIWRDVCDNSDQERRIFYVYYVGLAVLCVNGLWWVCYTLWLADRQGRGYLRIVDTRPGNTLIGRRFRPSQVPWEFCFRMINALAACVMMWIFLAVFCVYRETIKSAGDDNDDHHWSFGQVLALTTLASAVIGFFCAIKGEAPAGSASC